MKKVVCILVALAGVITSLQAQEAAETAIAKDTSYWKKGGTLSLNFNNTSLSNWTGGGQSSIAFGSIINLSADYAKGKNNWSSNLNWSGGMARVGNNSNLIKKSDDQLIVFTKYRRTVKPNWGFAAFAELRTQMFLNSIYTANPDSTSARKEVKTDKYTSGFMAPGYLTTSIGWEYSKGKNIYIHATPLAGKGTFVLNDSLSGLGLYGLEKNQRVLFQLGSLVRVGYKTLLMENVTFATNLMLFSPYAKYGNIDVTWETLTSFKINKFLSTTFSTQMLYFDNSRPKITNSKGEALAVAKHGIQFKHVLNIGFIAKF